VVAVLALLTSAACQPRGPALRHVILISIDTLRQDALGCYGNTKLKTPHIDALAKDGVLFRQAFTHAPSTLPSHSSMFFSEYPWNLDVFHNGDKLAVREASLQGLLRGKGYKTAAFTSLAVLKATYGLAQGFDEYSDEVSRNAGRPYLFADEVNDKVLPWLFAHYQQPFFLFIHYSDPHEPYVAKNAPPDAEALLNGQSAGTFCFLKREVLSLDLELKPGRNTLVFRKLPQLGREARDYEIQQLRASEPGVRLAPMLGQPDAEGVMRFTDAASYSLENTTKRPLAIQLVFRGKASVGPHRMREQYLREVEWVDEAIGKLVAWLKAHDSYENCLLLLVADHGEGLGEHGSFGHETQLYTSQLRIPFLLVDHRRAARSAQARLLERPGPG
jgi:membrane-anchored protein YejM (alkaline phosphatase superfamily)